ncbi:hypothetical protein MMP65_01555 [Acinetobacter sp. ANC 3926]|uniref:Uncharacterized protein n=1 Tax=Acinetobacter genomosp. 15BJ TaxID=106651 RepID=R9AUY9_9GAMM|nr:hypothetical protein [Acinetobacter genomosp. 15BJ]EOR06059.1 hypothetical protein F896_02517 [Acinetobacter genomosp. 15BJ]MCH7290157.1 hypothetical protein [Acinetobacter genomosp. 15BJ]
MTETIIYLFKTIPFAMLGGFSLILFFILSISLYIYISMNLRGILRIIFKDEAYFKLPLEPFNYFFISILPLVFWREILNIKRGVIFKKLYDKNFYYPLNKNQLFLLLKKYPLFFFIQYFIFLFSLLFLIFGTFFSLFEKV